MELRAELKAALTRCPFVAILRGVTPDAVEAIGAALIDAGFAMIEVPLNSPDPIASIARLQRAFGDRVLIGGGTMLSTDDVAKVADTGARLMISPNTDQAVIAAAAARGMIALPGYFTPSEGLAAMSAGATALKLFPAEGASPAVLSAHRAVLPRETPVLVVGGVTPDTIGVWRGVADGFGLGSALYRPGDAAAVVARRAAAFVTAARSI